MHQRCASVHVMGISVDVPFSGPDQRIVVVGANCGVQRDQCSVRTPHFRPQLRRNCPCAAPALADEARVRGPSSSIRTSIRLCEVQVRHAERYVLSSQPDLRWSNRCSSMTLGPASVRGPRSLGDWPALSRFSSLSSRNLGEVVPEPSASACSVLRAGYGAMHGDLFAVATKRRSPCQLLVNVTLAVQPHGAPAAVPRVDNDHAPFLRAVVIVDREDQPVDAVAAVPARRGAGRRHRDAWAA